LQAEASGGDASYPTPKHPGGVADSDIISNPCDLFREIQKSEAAPQPRSLSVE